MNSNVNNSTFLLINLWTENAKVFLLFAFVFVDVVPRFGFSTYHVSFQIAQRQFLHGGTKMKSDIRNEQANIHIIWNEDLVFNKNKGSRNLGNFGIQSIVKLKRFHCREYS